MGGGTTTLNGTSMAAAHVGGGAALYLSWNTTASPAAVEGALRSGARTTIRKTLLENVGGF